MLKRLILNLLLISMGAIILPSFSIAEKSINVHLDPDIIYIDAFYNGAQVSVLGEIPRDAEVLVQMTGIVHDVELLKKGRVLGILWMNTGSIVIKNIPSAYKLYLPKSVNEEMLSQDSKWKNLGIGFDDIKKNVELIPENEDKDFQFKEFVKLKKHEGFYSVDENAIVYKDTGDNMKSFSCRVTVPCSLSPGDYAIDAFVVKNNTLLTKVHKGFEIKESGFPELLSNIAFNHGALYGILATIIALCAGLIMGVLFKGSQGGH